MNNLNICSFTKPGILTASMSDKGMIERIEGHFALTGVVSTPDWWGEAWELESGIFKKALKEKQDQFLLAHHDFEKVLGCRDEKTAEFKSVDEGLWGACSFPDTTYARDLSASLGRRDIKSSSFGFNILDYKYRQADGMDICVIARLELWEASVVTIPRFSQTKGLVHKILPAGLEPKLAASLFRALNRAEHELEMDEDDKSILVEYRSTIENRLPSELKAKIASRGLEATPIVSAPAVNNHPSVLKAKLFLERNR